MERLDYRINEDGLERWISTERVEAILAEYSPNPGDRVDLLMQIAEGPVEVVVNGKKVRIEYKGPHSDRVCAGVSFANKLGLLCLFALLITGVGCKRMDRVMGTEKKADAEEQAADTLHIVACCLDNNNGVTSYPPFLPPDHVALCQNVKAAAHRGERYQGGVWIAMGVDCGPKFGFIGSEYYAGKNY